MLNHHHNFDGFSCISHRINYGLYEYLFNVIVVLISPVFLGLPYRRSKGYHLTLLQEGRGKGDGLGEGMGLGGRTLHDIPKMAAKEISFYMNWIKKILSCKIRIHKQN